MSYVLSTEIKICEAVKAILEANHRLYIRKYSYAIRRNGQPTGRRSHKFYFVYRSNTCPDNLSFNSVMDDLTAAVKAIDNKYSIEQVVGQYGSTSIRVYPII